MSRDSFKIKDTLSLEPIPLADVSSISPKEGDIVKVGGTVDGVLNFHNGTELLPLNISTAEIDVVLRNRFDTSSNSAVTELIPQFPWTSPISLSNPAILPTSGANKICWSPNGEFLVVSHTVSPFITIYQRSGNTFTKLANPSTLPTGGVLGSSWSPDGQFLATAHSTSPFITIYQRSGSTFTKIADPVLPPSTGRDVSWTPNSQFLAVAHSSSPYLTVYRRSGTTFTKLTDPTTLPPGTANSVAWCPNGNLLAVRNTNGTSSAYLQLYTLTNTGTTMVKTTDPVSQPGVSGALMSWSFDGKFLAMGGTLTSKMFIYQRSGTTLTKLSDPSTQPSDQVNGVCFSLNNKLLVAVNNDAVTPSARLNIYSISSTNPPVFTKLSNPATSLPANGRCAEFSPDGQFLAVGHANNLTIYQTSSDIEDNSLLRIVNPKLGNQ